VRKFPDGRQRRFLTLAEVGKLGAAMRAAEAAGENPVAVECVRFLLLTGLRRMEALGLPWEWVDARARCLRLGDSKSGYSLRPLGVEATLLLERLPRVEGSPWVFGGADPAKHLVGLPKALDRLCARAGLAGVTVHVLRHSHAATAAEMGFGELTIAGLLGHRVAGVTARYSHIGDPALLVAADRVSARIAAALDGREAAEVVPLAPSPRLAASA
jgi:integrase